MPITHPIAEVRAWLTLLRAPNFGASAIRQRIAHHRSAQAALVSAKRDTRVHEAARSWMEQPDEETIARDLSWLDEQTHHFITITDDDYPVLLIKGQNPPAALFVAGDPTLLWTPQIAIVGSRMASTGGLANASAFAKAFVQAGNTVTSGLAEGIDGAAHTAALDAGGNTIAVLGTGPDVIYPRHHTALAERIVEHGALVSEFSPGTTGRPEYFPRRNRIIAGLTLGTLVVEANLKSGSLITARLANEQGREVFALPGSIHHPMARGCHQLIREGAKLVETADEVLEELHGVGSLLANDLRRRLTDAETQAPSSAASNHDDDPDYVKLLSALDAHPLALDELAERTSLAAAALSSMLLVLELDGVVAAENGRYARR
jgi:DNA processing protein